MILLSIKSAVYYMICLLLSTLGIIEFEEAWNPSRTTITEREEQMAVFASLQMPHRSVKKLQIDEFFDQKPGVVQKIPERNVFPASIYGMPSDSCNDLPVIGEVMVGLKKQPKETVNMYVYLIAR